MPSYGTYDTTTETEIAAMQPVVSVGTSQYDFCTCLSIEKNTGLIPSKAFIRIAGNNYDIAGNITLNAYSFPDIKHGSRVRVDNGLEPLFLGQLIVRRDQGQGNSIIWEAWDDRWLLSKIPVRGCLVWDPVAGAVKFISRYIARVNPQGRRNCVGAALPGIDGVVPVFTALPEQQAAYDDSDTDVNLAAGEVSAWTPSKFIKYLCALTQLAPGAVDGVNADSWRSLAPSTRLGWKYMDCQFASDPNQSMDKKLPDRIFQAQTVLSALHEVLRMGSAYGLRIGYDNDSGGSLKSFIKFYPRDRSIGSSGAGSPQNNVIYLQRGGAASDIRTAWDFELDEDASGVCESVLVEGDAVHIESQLQYLGNGSDPLQPAWSSDEQTAFGWIVMAADPAAPGTPVYARYPLTLPDVSKGKTWAGVAWANADGTGTNPLALVKTKEALQLARQILPRVFRAFEINSQNAASILAGYNGKYASTTTFPFLELPRPILPEQTQYYIDQQARKTRLPFPVRIQVSDHGANSWHDCTPNNGLRISGDGLIWIDGLTDDIDSGDDVYVGQLTQGPYTGGGAIALRDIRINAAVSADIRKSALITDSARQLEAALSTELGGGLMLYVDSPEGFREEHQVDSYPAALTSFASASGTAATPLNRILTDDSARAITHATRRVARKKWIRRISSWKMIGIRPEFDAGMYIDRIKVAGQTGDQDYLIQAPIETVSYDFVAQVTAVGGLA